MYLTLYVHTLGWASCDQSSMYFGLRDGLQTGIKWDNVVDIPVQNYASKILSQKRFWRSFSSEFRPHSPLLNAWCWNDGITCCYLRAYNNSSNSKITPQRLGTKLFAAAGLLSSTSFTAAVTWVHSVLESAWQSIQKFNKYWFIFGRISGYMAEWLPPGGLAGGRKRRWANQLILELESRNLAGV